MTKQRWLNLGMRAVTLLRWLAPYETGNLSHNAVQFEVTETEFKIFIDEAVAPYMPYTNEEWVSKKWNGKKNPNEGWFERAVQIILKMVKQELEDLL